VMELADREGAVAGETFEESLRLVEEAGGDWRPRTLRSALESAGRLPLAECIEHARCLAHALASLHRAGLTHRDIKPSNIIFVNHRPKLADIGLVTGMGESHSFVGTEGFIPPEGPGEPQADIYALGMTFYAMATGRAAREFPAIPPEWAQPDGAAALEFMEVIIRATEAQPARRYQSASEMLADLALLESGKSVRRMRILEQRWMLAKRLAPAALLVLAAAGAAVWFWRTEEMREQRTRTAEALAVQARHDERGQRFLALRERAAAVLRSPLAGSAVEAMQLIDQAAALRKGDPLLRDLLITALTRADFAPLQSWTHGLVNLAPVISNDGTLVALAQQDGSVRIQRVTGGGEVRRLAAWANCKPWDGMRFTADGRFLGVTYAREKDPDPGRFRWWRIADGAVVWEGGPEIRSLGGVPAAGAVITGYDARRLELIRYDLDAGREKERTGIGIKEAGLSLSPDGHYALFYDPGHTHVESAVLMALSPPALLREIRMPVMKGAVAWSRDSRQLIVGGGATPFEIHVWDVRDAAAAPRRIRAHFGEVVDVALSPCGQYLLSSSWDQTTRLTHLVTGQAVAMAPGWGHSGSLGFTADGRHCWRTIVHETGGSPMLQLAAFHQAAVTIPFPGPRQWVDRSFFSRDGRWLALTGDQVSLIDLKTGEARHGLFEQNGGCRSCCFLTNDSGQALLAACPGGLYRLPLPSESSGFLETLQPELLAKGRFEEVGGSANERVAIGFGFDVPGVILHGGHMEKWPSLKDTVSGGISADGAMVVTTSAFGKDITVQKGDGTLLQKFPAGLLSWVEISPDAQSLFVNRADAFSRLRASDGHELWRVRKEFPVARGEPILLDDARLILARLELGYVLLDAESGVLRCRLDPVFPFHPQAAGASADGARAATASREAVLLWDLRRIRAELRRRDMDW
jgi:WD40 repeat protein